jgi:uncharacterized protein YprB with RNaseH-like and TPR domain
MVDLNESLADKLRSLGVQIGADKIQPPPKVQRGIEDIVNGTFLPTPFGEVFCADIVSNIDYAHGIIPMIPRTISQHLALWNKSDPAIAYIDPSTIIFLDTETTGLSGGTGTLPFMIGLGWFSDQGFTTAQLFIRNPAEEPAQLAKLDQLLTNARAIVTYNGKSFDVPILQSRYVINGLSSPLKNLPHFDLLPLSRRLWRRRLENRSLKDIEKEILGFTRSQMEVPGWEIPIIYFNYLRTLDPTPMAGVFYHNAIDILSLAALFLFVNQVLDEPEDRTDLAPIDQLSLAIFFEDTGEIENAIAKYEQLLNFDLPDIFATELRLRYGRVLKRSGQYERAVQVLNQENGQQDIRVLIQLAKVLEHQYRDNESALQWTSLAQEKLNEISISLPTLVYHQQKSELQKRRDRLIRKINDNTGSNLE